MKVLILVTLLTLCALENSTPEPLNFSELLNNLNELYKADDLTISNISYIKPTPNSAHPCKCEAIFVQKLNESMKSVESSSHNDQLANIMDILKGLHLPENMKNPKEETIEECKKTSGTTRKMVRRNSLKLSFIKKYISSSIAFIKEWNLKYCRRSTNIVPKHSN